MPSSVSGPQPVGCARSGLASAPSSLTPFPSIIPISSPGLAPARYLSTDLSPKNPCPALTVSTHPALFPSSPPTNHLPQGHWVHHTLCRALTQVESQPCPTWQPTEGSQQRQKQRARAQYLAGLSVFRTTHSPLCTYHQPVPSLKAARSLGLLPIVWVRIWSLSYQMPRLATTHTLQQKALSLSPTLKLTL